MLCSLALNITQKRSAAKMGPQTFSEPPLHRPNGRRFGLTVVKNGWISHRQYGSIIHCSLSKIHCIWHSPESICAPFNHASGGYGSNHNDHPTTTKLRLYISLIGLRCNNGASPYVRYPVRVWIGSRGNAMYACNVNVCDGYAACWLLPLLGLLFFLYPDYYCGTPLVLVNAHLKIGWTQIKSTDTWS